MVESLMPAGTPTFTIVIMPFSTIRLVIELDPEWDPISGTVQQEPDGEPTPFTGWLQLTQTLESMRQSPIAPSPRLGPEAPHSAR